MSMKLMILMRALKAMPSKVLGYIKKLRFYRLYCLENTRVQESSVLWVKFVQSAPFLCFLRKVNNSNSDNRIVL